MILRRDSFYRSGLAAILVVALLLRGLIPAGMMPDFRAPNGVIRLVICTGYGPMELPADQATGQPVKADPSAPASPLHHPVETHDLCPFAGGFVLADVPALVLLALLVPLVRGVVFYPAPLVARCRAVYPRWFARGPPGFLCC